MTTLLRSFNQLGSVWQAGVVTIGNFDGLHLGHQQLIERVVQRAKQEQRPSILITFEPLPHEWFAKEHSPPARLMRLREKYYFLRRLGLDLLLVLPFNSSLMSLPAEDFIQQVLYKSLKINHLIIGDDFHFGAKRRGNYQMLQHYAAQYSYTVAQSTAVVYENQRISSTRVREALATGDHNLTLALLGRPYSMIGRVRQGARLGRQLGFPTANIFVQRRVTPVHGIYFVLVRGLSEKLLPGAANIGTRPTVNGNRILLEVHLLDFTADIYGREVEVIFCKKLRCEERYDSLQKLQQAIANDVKQARHYFIQQGVL